MRQIKNKPIKLLGLILACCIAFTAAAALTATPTTATAEATFTVSDTLNVAHITDTHYYPVNYCYNGADLEGSDYETNLFTEGKLFLESSTINRQCFIQVLAEKPDYLVLSGDLTLDGELQSHIELSNLLRKLQNDVRAAGKPNFQVFVTTGNHDTYNPASKHFRDEGVSNEGSLPYTTRYDITKIYSSLGYPDMTTAEIIAYYETLDENAVFTDHLPYVDDGEEDAYDINNSTTASNLTFVRQTALDHDAGDDYDNGEISYIAYTDKYTFSMLDVQVSDEVVEHHVGGKLYDGTRTFMAAQAEALSFDEKVVNISVMHQNVIPHFDMEGTLLSGFTLYDYKASGDYLADLGIDYFFSGHMHSNDINTDCSLNGNWYTDIETGSVTGHLGGVRYCKIETGSYDGNAAQNFSSRIDLIDDTDFSWLFDGGYMSDNYITYCKLGEYITDEHICTNVSEYACTRLFKNIVSNILYVYITPEFISGLGDFVADILPADLADTLRGFGLSSVAVILDKVDEIVDNVVVHLEDVVLADYVYGGDNDMYKITAETVNARGYKICGYVDELVAQVLNLPVNDAGDTLFDFALGAYLDHVGGTDFSLADATDAVMQALERLEDGTTVKQLVDILLDEQKGLMRIVRGILMPMDLTKGMSEADSNQIETVLEGVANLFDRQMDEDDNIISHDFNAHALSLDDLAPAVLKIVGPLLGFNLDLAGGTLGEFIDNTIEGYLTESFYTSLGGIAYRIMYDFSIDETAAIETSFGEDMVLYKYDTTLPTTYYAAAPEKAASIEGGQLPGMLTVVFGENPTTEKTFTWYTDKRVEGTDIQYIDGEWNEANATTVLGTFEVYATTNAGVDLGILAIDYINIDVGRHVVNLKNLTPGTTYSYRVGSSADGWWSPVYTFTTAPADNAAFDLLLITDIQGSVVRPYETVNSMMPNINAFFENGYDFIINCGDTVDNSRNLVQWQYMLDVMQGTWGNTTQVNAVGNHEEHYYELPEDAIDNLQFTEDDHIDGTYNYLQAHYNFAIPEQDEKTGIYYSFDYSGVHFTVLNTNDIKNDKLGDTQYQWLLDDLDATDKEYKVVMMHKGLYSAGSHINDADVIGLRNQLTSVFAEKGVQLVLQGHDHTYSESYYLDKDGNVVGTNYDGVIKKDCGTLYVSLGTLADKTYKYNESDEIPLATGKELHTPVLRNPTFGKLSYDGTTLRYTGYEYNLTTGEITPTPLPTEEVAGMNASQIALTVLASVAAAGAIICLGLYIKSRFVKAA